MALFDDLPDIIADVLGDADLGFQSVTLTSITAGTYDPATGTVTGGSTTTTSVRAVVEDFKGLSLLNGLIQAGDKKITVAAANVTTAPKPTDTVTVGGIVYAVVNVVTVQPGSAAVIYEIQARKA
jgi:hypothetical protein